MEGADKSTEIWQSNFLYQEIETPFYFAFILSYQLPGLIMQNTFISEISVLH